MQDQDQERLLEQQIDQWRNFLRRRQAIHSVDIAELEDHLREQVAALVEAGLATDEAFLVAVKRMGDIDSLSREFAREHSDRLWRQLVAVPVDDDRSQSISRKEAFVAFGLAVTAALLFKLPVLFGKPVETNESFYALNIGFFVLPLLAGYFVWKRQLATTTTRWLAVAFVAAALVVNSMPFISEGHTELLAVVHLPIALWLLIGIAYAGGRWGEVSGRMDFVRFSGELFIYYVLMALGGGVLTGFMVMIFETIGVDVEPILGTWWIPCGALGAVMVGAWLVEAKQSVIENMAPVLTRLFSPLFAVVLLAFLATMLWTGNAMEVEREVLIAFDLLLAVVAALLLYSASARDPNRPPGAFDVVQVVLVVSALLANGVALWAIATRISEFGFSPNRVAALGENLILLVNLVWAAVLYIRFMRAKATFAEFERWQTNYLPVYAVWAAIVVVVFPPLFQYI